MDTYFTIQGHDEDGRWDESSAGNDPDANHFDSHEAAAEALDELLCENPDYGPRENWRVHETEVTA